MSEACLITPTLRQHIKSALTHLDQVLPTQAPMLAFEHRNPLRDYQHLPFNHALATAKAYMGINGYLPEAHFREIYQHGRINDADIAAALHQDPSLQADTILLLTPAPITHATIYRIALLFELEPASPTQLAWACEELNSLETFQPDIPHTVRQQLLSEHTEDTTEKTLIADLWQLLLNKLDLEQTYLHPENRLDLSLDQAEALLAQHKASQKKVSLKKATLHERMQEAINKTFAQELQRLGVDYSLRNLMMDLCGIDILDNVRTQMIRLCSSALDEGLAAWQLPGRSENGLYAAWRAVAGLDINPFLQELPDWQAIIAALPDNAEDAIILQLTDLEIPPAQWDGYLRCLAMEMPGWSGMINWREQHPEYTPLNDTKPTLADYLAIRLTLDRLWLNQICRDTWQIEATLSCLQTYFRKNASEYLVRIHLFRGDLPEYLIPQAETLILSLGATHYNRNDWQTLADIIWTWQGSSMTNSRPVHSIYDSAWQLFRLSQHLGLTAQHWQDVSKAELEHILTVLKEFTPARRSEIWLLAYERHYRDTLLHAIHTTHQHAQKTIHQPRPNAQCIFSMDNREEGLRLQLEATHLGVETFGAANFFIDLNAAASDNTATKLTRSQWLKQTLRTLWHHSLRSNLLLSPLLMLIALPFTLTGLIACAFFPKWHQSVINRLNQPITTATDSSPDTAANTATPNPEQIKQLAQLFHTLGLTTGFSPLVVFIGQPHQNNPTRYREARNAYPNGSQAATIALFMNRADVRGLLAEQDVSIPNDTWFMAAEHDTDGKHMTWYSDNLPETHHATLKHLQDTCARKDQQGATEKNASTGIAAVIGRRAMTQNVFLEQSVFLASYDAMQDSTGEHLEALLLCILPRMSDINLAYYFATVDNYYFGSGNSTLHNAISQLGVMEGASSDLRNGLSKQMTIHHAAMRLLVLIEIKPNLLTDLLARQAALRPLIQQAWLQLNVQDPETGELFVVNPDLSFTHWSANQNTLAAHAPVAAGNPESSARLTVSVHG